MNPVGSITIENLETHLLGNRGLRFVKDVR